MPALIELDDRDRRIARRMQQALNGAATLQDCEEAVQLVKECRRHGIDPASIMGPAMETFIAMENVVDEGASTVNSG